MYEDKDRTPRGDPIWWKCELTMDELQGGCPDNCFHSMMPCEGCGRETHCAGRIEGRDREIKLINGSAFKSYVDGLFSNTDIACAICAQPENFTVKCLRCEREITQGNHMQCKQCHRSGCSCAIWFDDNHSTWCFICAGTVLGKAERDKQ